MNSEMNLDYKNLRSLFNQTPEILCILSGPEHRFEFVNEAHIKTLGFDATGKTVREAQPESVEIHGILDAVFQSGETAALHEIPITLTDRLRYFNLTYAPRKDASGNVNGVMVLGTEITEQILFRQAQQAQNSWLKLVLDHIPTPIFLIEPETTEIIFANQTANKITGRSLEQSTSEERLSEHGLQVIQHGKILTSEEIPSARAARGEIFKDEEITLRTRHGDFLVTASSGLLPSSYGIKKTALLVLNDVTTLRTSQEQLSAVIEVARIGFYDWDVQNDVLVFSDQMKKDWGLEDVSSHTNDLVLKLIHPDDRERVEQAIQKSLTENLDYPVQFRVNRRDGDTIWVEARGKATYNEEGQPIRFFGTSHEITEEKLIEAELTIAKTAAEDANAAKSAFLANMSHEIRTPLGAIMGFVDLMRKKQLTPEELDAYITIISRNSGQLVRIIDDILDLSKVEAGHMLVEKMNFNLSDLLSDFASLMSFKASEKGILFEVHAESPIPHSAYSDPTRIRQVLNNIVGNAIKFTASGRVDLRVTYHDDQLEFLVNDTGVGMTQAQSEKLFHAFAQADASTTRKFGGTGLGLVLTQKICTLLEGEFTLVSSTPGKGSSFRAIVRAPRATGARMLDKNRFDFSSKPAERVVENQVLAGAKILVVDDSPDNRALVSITLNEMGAVVDLASDGSEGVQKALTNPYDLILMDLQMPVMDGHEAIRKLKEHQYPKPVIAFTAHAMREERERCLANGFAGFLSKPLDRELLQNEIVLHLSRNHSIMIVEDDEDLRDLMLMFFRDEGENVFWAPSAEDALIYLETHALPPLVLLDLTLPKMSGEEFIERIRDRSDRSKSRVIVASGWKDLDQKCEELKADGFLRKPFQLEQLEALIKR